MRYKSSIFYFKKMQYFTHSTEFITFSKVFIYWLKNSLIALVAGEWMEIDAFKILKDLYFIFNQLSTILSISLCYSFVIACKTHVIFFFRLQNLIELSFLITNNGVIIGKYYDLSYLLEIILQFKDIKIFAVAILFPTVLLLLFYCKNVIFRQKITWKFDEI